MCQILKILSGQRTVSTEHVADGVQLSLIHLAMNPRHIALLLLFPESSHNRSHVPSGDRFAKQRLIEGGQMVALAVVEEFVQLLRRQPGEPVTESGGYVTR